MRVAIVYFSGTGNTKNIGFGYKKHLENMGHVVDISSIENIAYFEDHDVLIVGGAIYAGTMPHKLI